MSGWLNVCIHQSEKRQWDLSLGQSDKSIWYESDSLWVTVSVWWVISWLTDSVLNDWWGGDLVECVCVPEVINRTHPKFTGWISNWPCLWVLSLHPFSFLFELFSPFDNLSHVTLSQALPLCSLLTFVTVSCQLSPLAPCHICFASTWHHLFFFLTLLCCRTFFYIWHLLANKIRKSSLHTKLFLQRVFL